MPDRMCRWGILGTANIARKNWKALRNAGNAQLVAVASRSAARAEEFIRECQAQVPHAPPPAACSRYEDLLARPDIDAVYIPLPTGLRKEWVIKAAEKGKHVVCEKPCGVDAAEVTAMLAACRQHQVQFMDGVMFMHSARLPAIRQVLDEGTSLGTLKRIATQFSFRAPEEFLRENIRVSSDLEPMGCLGDLGWYNVRFTLWVMNYQRPQFVSGRLLAQQGRPDSPAAVPLEFSGELFFSEGVSASFYCSFLTEHQQWAHVSGSRGSLQVPDFVLPNFGSEAVFDVSNPVFSVQGCDFNMENHTRRLAVHEYSNGFAQSQETHLFRHFSALVLERRLEPHWGQIALLTQEVLDACLKSAQQDGQRLAM